MIRIGIACCLLAACAAGAIVLGQQTSQAQIAPPKVIFEYAAKIVCGKAPNQTLVERGFYSVAVNVHNPSAKPTNFFRCKVALAEVAQDGRISPFGCKQIDPDRVQVFNCRFFLTLFPPPSPGPFIDGFFVIQSDTKLDVTAYYTSVGITGPTGAEVPSKIYSPSIAVERIAERVLIDGIPQ